MPSSRSLFTINSIILIINALSLFVWILYYDTPQKVYFYSTSDHEMSSNHSNESRPAPIYPFNYSDYMLSLSEALKPKNRKITLIVTSCGRTDLLTRTIWSFNNVTKNKARTTYEIKNKIMIEDCCKSGSQKCVDILNRYNADFNIIFTAKNKRFQREKAIMNALQFAHAEVDTQWIYHIEDDWEFYANNETVVDLDVIEMSLRVYESNFIHLQSEEFKNPNNGWYNAHINQSNDTNNRYMYSCVSCTNHHVKFERDQPLHSPINDDITWYEIQPTWTGFTFNAALYPTFIYKDAIKSFMDYKGEMDVSLTLMNKGFRYAALYPELCYHIGKDRHVSHGHAKRRTLSKT